MIYESVIYALSIERSYYLSIKFKKSNINYNNKKKMQAKALSRVKLSYLKYKLFLLLLRLQGETKIFFLI
jgi:hypothetical protein